MGRQNEMTLIVPAISENESFARSVVAAFATRLNPTLEELADIKTAVSEAVTNAIIHGYDENGEDVRIHCLIEGEMLRVTVTDWGRGIEDIAKAREPFYTGRPDQERSGMGFTMMETFMDELQVESAPGKGTRILLRKRISSCPR